MALLQKWGLHRNRPVPEIAETAIVDVNAIKGPVAALISENYPLRGKGAGDSMRQHLAKMSNKAADEGLTEDDVTRMLNEA